ncbi:lipoprotein [Spiroplasma endosymbiont of Panorpa germanica]|uniref:lipoprotein n=1 Tax=Spiroplasma endosymbiont of Panorpa germanica TaxID=3066314 RepID=UPI0030D12CDB
MKKLLALLASGVLISTAATSVIACSWKTPPIKFDEISRVMKEIERQVAENPNEETGVANLKADGEFGESLFDMNYVQKTENNSTNIDLRKKWSDGILNPINDTIISYVHEGKNITTGEKDEGFQDDELMQLASMMKTYHITTRVSDVYAENALMDEKRESFWLSDKYQNPVTGFQKTIDEGINPKEGNQPKNKNKNDLLINNQVQEKAGDWDKNFLIFDDNDVFNLSKSMRADYYVVRTNVSFGINRKDEKLIDKKVCFYLDVKFNA